MKGRTVLPAVVGAAVAVAASLALDALLGAAGISAGRALAAVAIAVGLAGALALAYEAAMRARGSRATQEIITGIAVGSGLAATYLISNPSRWPVAIVVLLVAVGVCALVGRSFRRT